MADTARNRAAPGPEPQPRPAGSPGRAARLCPRRTGCFRFQMWLRCGQGRQVTLNVAHKGGAPARPRSG